MYTMKAMEECIRSLKLQYENSHETEDYEKFKLRKRKYDVSEKVDMTKRFKNEE